VAAMRASAMRGRPFVAGVEQGAAALGVTLATAALTLLLASVRVGDAGSGGEMLPTVAFSVCFAALLGSSVACSVYALDRALGGQSVRAPRLAVAQVDRGRGVVRARVRSQPEGLRLQEAEASLGRLRHALSMLARARDSLSLRMRGAQVREDASLSLAYRRAIEEAAMKVELGERVLIAAEAAVFRFACGDVLAQVVRRRPREALSALAREEGSAEEGRARLGRAADELSAFQEEIQRARGSLAALRARRPVGVAADTDEDPWFVTRHDLEALGRAYGSLLSRVEMLLLRRDAEASIEEVASAASALSKQVPGQVPGGGELEELAIELTRAETAVVLATPVEGDPEAVTEALSRSMVALDRSDEGSLDGLLSALRSIV